MLPSKVLDTVVTESRDLNRFQSAVKTLLESVALTTILDGNLLENVAFTTSPVRIAHKLGRRPRGYIVVRANAALQVWDLAADNVELPEQYLNLRFSSSATASLWVF